MYQGLSTQQAPKIAVPLRFFLTAPIFGILIAIVFFIYPTEVIFDRYSPISVGVIHLFTLGVLAMTMFGALQQMLPVLAGAVIKKSDLFANIVHTNLTFGTLAMSGGFMFSSSLFLSVGSFMLTMAFGVFFFVLTKLLFQVKYVTTTVNAMKIFSLVGIITALLGLYLLSSHTLSNVSSIHYDIVNIHIAFGVFGFATILVMGVAFQVIPMFYVARDFPKSIQEKFPRVVFGMLVLFAIFTILKQDTNLILAILSLIAIIFGYFGLVSLNNRKRPVFDVTLWYWKFSLYSLIVSQILFIFFDNYMLMSIVFILGFLYSLLQGMIYKIIPFLSWFHLSSNGHFMIPNLREYIDADAIKIQFFIYLSSIFFFILSVFMNQLFLYIASGLFLFSNLFFILNLTTAILKYRKIISSK